MKSILAIAMKEAGTKEVSGKVSNERILQYATDVGFEEYINDDIAWCSLFMNWVALKSDHEKSNKLNARSWLNIGLPIENPEPGDVVVFWRQSITSWKGHVGLFVGYSADLTRIYCLGGNQSDQVAISGYPSDRLLGFRRLKHKNALSFGRRNIKEGHTGMEVRKLQNTLNQLGFNSGTVDGYFGPKTKKAVQIFQSTHADLEMNGIADKKTKEKLLSILNQS